jgi:hypothetical protein
MKMEQTDCSETSAHKIQTPRNNPKERVKHPEHGQSLKSRLVCFCFEVKTDRQVAMILLEERDLEGHVHDTIDVLFWYLHAGK